MKVNFLGFHDLDTRTQPPALQPHIGSTVKRAWLIGQTFYCWLDGKPGVLIDIERQLTLGDINALKMRVSDMLPGADFNEIADSPAATALDKLIGTRLTGFDRSWVVFDDRYAVTFTRGRKIGWAERRV